MLFGISLFACGSASIPENKLQGRTSSIVAPEVMPALSNLQMQSVAQSDLARVFDSAQKVYPPAITSDGSGTPDGYTITFFDFYGVSFAYVSQVSRATKSLEPQVLAARHNLSAKAPEDEKTWQDATYVTGANTRRTTLGSYTYGFPVLYGLYSQESQAKGFRPSDVTKFVMPVAGYYWAYTTSGRYFDLLTRDWVEPSIVEKLKQAYNTILSTLTRASDYKSIMTKNWKAFNGVFKIRPGDCPSAASSSECVPSNVLTPKTTAPFCFTRWFLWWSWWDCSSVQGNYTSDGQEVSGTSPLLSQFSTIANEDNDQFDYQGAASGCGPNAGKNLLKWWQTYGNFPSTTPTSALPLRSAGGGYTPEQNTQIELIGDMGAYISGNGRAINSSGCGGMQQYLTRYNVKLGVACAEGIWVITGWVQQFITAFNANIPVAVSHFVIGYGGHVGIAKHFRTDPYGNLYVKVFNNPFPFNTWNLAEVFAASGVYYLYKL